jgi:peptidoglycan/LPS O-acetylase OafA/YrhL
LQKIIFVLDASERSDAVSSPLTVFVREVVVILVDFMHRSWKQPAGTADCLSLSRSYPIAGFFLMLGSFVIANAHGRRLLTGMSLWQFALRRMVRICPLLVLGRAAAVSLLRTPFGGPQFLRRAA